jgi:hypothetical protein
MGAGVLFNLIESSPNRLRYRCTATGSGAPTPIPNSGGTSPDVRTDSMFQLHALLATPAVDDAAAARLLNGEGLTSIRDVHTPRAHMHLTPETSAQDETWGVIAKEGNSAGSPDSAGFAVPVVTEAFNGTAILDIVFDHSLTR